MEKPVGILTRAEARKLDLKRYFTGKSCPKGHIAWRQTSNGECMDCRLGWVEKNPDYWANRYQKDPEAEKARSAEWREKTGYNRTRYANNRESEKARQKRYVEENRAEVMRQRKAHRDSNIEEFRAREKRGRDARPHIHLAYNQRRRAARMQAIPGWFGEFDEFVISEAAMLCALRESATGLRWHIDHLIPLQARTASGLHCAGNIQVIPAITNIRKRNRMVLTQPLEWLAHI